MSVEYLKSLTVGQFKDFFPNDFPYLPVWLASNTYNTGDIVYYSVNRRFYICISDNVTSIPGTLGQWEVIQDTISSYVLDKDIENSMGFTIHSINVGLFSELEELEKAFFYKAAHFLLLKFLQAGSGSAGPPSWAVNSRSVGSVSESYALPAHVTNSWLYSVYSSTRYGLMYLLLVSPKLKGIGVVGGMTLP